MTSLTRQLTFISYGRGCSSMTTVLLSKSYTALLWSNMKTVKQVGIITLSEKFFRNDRHMVLWKKKKQKLLWLIKCLVDGNIVRVNIALEPKAWILRSTHGFIDLALYQALNRIPNISFTITSNANHVNLNPIIFQFLSQFSGVSQSRLASSFQNLIFSICLPTHYITLNFYT